jgi:hypothetical protein
MQVYNNKVIAKIKNIDFVREALFCGKGAHLIRVKLSPYIHTVIALSS